MPELVALIEQHFEAVAAGRVDEVVDRYAASGSTYVFVEGPRWSTTGIERIAAGWRAYHRAPFRVVGWRWIEGPVSDMGRELGFVAGVVELDVRRAEQLFPVRFRGTHVLARQADGAWHIVHEHLSQPAPDPYGTGDWLPDEASARPR